MTNPDLARDYFLRAGLPGSRGRVRPDAEDAWGRWSRAKGRRLRRLYPPASIQISGKFSMKYPARMAAPIVRSATTARG